MIDLSFLTEAEQEAILRVLNRDAELKKAEEERVRHLYDAVDDENELKYKSGQWFYEAKSKRHRDKIHGADLVRASMRKRKAPPATLAELSRNYKENSKKSWVSSVNKDVFIPPELYGVMEDQEEEQGGFVPVKIEPTQSSKRVSFLSTDKNMESSKNGNVSPSRQRRNPFNSTNEGDDDTELGKDTHEPVNGPESGDKVSYPDNDPLYAAVKKPSGSFSSGLSQDKKPESESPDASKRNSIDPKQGIEESDPILRALKRSSTKTLPPLPVQEVSLEKSNQDDITVPKEDRDHTYEEVRADKVVPERSHFSDPEKLKRLSQSVPSFLNDDTDGRETDSASESSFQLGRHKKSPSSLTNLSGSSGMASLSSVSGSVMSIYSGDFGNVDIKGNIQFALDYADNLQEFQVFVSQCKDLAAADVKKQRSDPYVKAYLLPEKAKMGKRKTGVKKKTLNPVYNDVLRYKISKNALLSQTLNLSVWHHDVLGRNSFLGEVDVNLASWDWSNKQMNWYPLQPRTPAAGIGLENRGEMKLALKYVPEAFTGAKNAGTGEVHIWLKECTNLPMLRGNKINSFIKCTILPDTSRKSRQKTRAVDKTPNPYFNHTMVYDGFRKEDLKEACVELTVWDHNKLTNHFLGGLRIGLGTGKSYGTPVDWMDSNAAEATTWEKMITSPDTWVEAILPLRMLKMAKMAK
ncbi:synaptotagmin-like protein 2 isoform X6 [Xenopus tropicalis]|uniref:Synaptotagmin-like protein 2 n=1 Tax=Xenopus tropicalis TaxID=8364 RepID=A0A8J0SFC1_XENTR|nr:synaptotagmin-like protein 2 isoform X6 [Xenopus tropicalis]